MSIQLIQQYYTAVEKIIHYSGSRNESSLRKPFQDLLEQYARSKNLLLVSEVEMVSRKGNRIRPDGVFKDALRQNWGYWESKDEKDFLEDEIATKIAKGYPTFNILFEDTHTAVLYQGGEEIMRTAFNNAPALDALLTRFVSYQPAEVVEFRKAIELFCAEVGGLADTLRRVITEQLADNLQFKTALTEFLELARKAINPNIELADVREMIIQHVLTEDIFMRVFDEAEFHRENIIARKLQEVAGTFYHGETKRNIHARVAPYYETINAKASQISDHHEKQKFLKALYESFYKAYNPKAADRLGIVYTPDEIVRFMIESADHLVDKHFGKTLGDKGVEILDPATGTGTFITELIEYLPSQQLEYKYEHEIHCNEVSILPYYIANLNIEYTYKQKTGKFKEFENICFVDTLDNMGFEHSGKQLNFFGLTDANAERIVKQNSKPIMVVIGNPPYNANQLNENENNKNREYPEIDKRIKETYVKQSTAQKTKLYDMYARFLRWASDRLDKDGVIAFVSNNSFLNARSYDGFRKIVANEFNEIHIIDLKGDARISGEQRRKEGGNVFSDQIRVGVAVYFFVRKKGLKGCRIYYNAIADYAEAEEKKAYLRDNKFTDLKFQPIRPDKNNNWINLSENDWEEYIPLASKEGKSKKGLKEPKTIFKMYSLGVATNRDEWVYDERPDLLENKIKYFIDLFKYEKNRWALSDKRKATNDFVDRSIKWTSELEAHLIRGTNLEFSNKKITTAMYRPFVKRFFYYDMVIVHRPYLQPIFFKIGEKPDNLAICINMNGRQFNVLSVNAVPDLHFNGDSQCLPLYRYRGASKTSEVSETSEVSRVENITDWALNQFQKHYKDAKIVKEDIFHYVYAVLHHPAYRAKYEINLKREFPRIPFYGDFWKWADRGKRLMNLHLNYESMPAYPLERLDLNAEETRKALSPRLMARKDAGIIEVDTFTTLKGVPAEAWEYRLGTYSALEWVLERYKEKKPKAPTIAEKFNTYRFKDYKEQVIDLLCRVCAVSVETMKIVKEMREVK
ncbi:MAG: DNA methyltransferase [Chloroflexi bacterium GWB2_49_20]|nr:MAG: DNA methyltransferase [Chloroflexi bacterium GWB2_49_20]OGN79295.1 MAG: DNA methyltransferase [Chloroflexi bacterium GWC2_49_37]OGN82935.1 MAG: DNA methyltransferase [Chloroflexi bacterium GWD2_49_16]